MAPRRVPLILAPTPLHRLDKLSEALKVDLWIKRDDLTGFAFGGNKGRKLEYLMADVLDQGAEVVVTCGATQSNFVRQLGAACSRYGILCVAATMVLPFEDAPPSGRRLSAGSGNVVLDQILGVDLRIYRDGTWEELFGLAEKLALEYEAKGARVYRIPIGGSAPLGAYAFYEASKELAAQAEPFDHIVFASSSGSTHTGLAYGLYGSSTQLTGIACDPEPEIAEDFARLAAGLEKLVGLGRVLRAEDFRLDFRFVGAGYGVPDEQSETIIALVARLEGIFLDPIYSGKAFTGLLGLLGGGKVSGRVLFWHTGGTPTLFA